MPAFDATTLLLVNAVFNGFAGLVWLLLAWLFRIAPQASLMLAASHLLTLPALLRSPCMAALRPAGLPTWLPELSTLLAVAMLVAALRRMLRLNGRYRDLALLVAAMALLTVLGALGDGGGSSASLASRAATSAGVLLLAGLALRDVLAHAGAEGWRWDSLLLLVPCLGLLLFSGGRLLVLLQGQASSGMFGGQCRGHNAVAWVWLLQSLSLTLALVVLVLRRLVRRIEQLTRSDSLTGLLNRRAIDERLARLHLQLGRGQPYALAVLDLDFFKRINDQHGHAAGDAALQHVAGLMRQQVRPGDAVGRLGGEEFCVLMPGAALAEAIATIEGLCRSLASSEFRWRGQLVPLAVSAGVSAGLPADADGPAATLAAADAQLYRAKASGRNRVCAEGHGT